MWILINLNWKVWRKFPQISKLQLYVTFFMNISLNRNINTELFVHRCGMRDVEITRKRYQKKNSTVRSRQIRNKDNRHRLRASNIKVDTAKKKENSVNRNIQWMKRKVLPKKEKDKIYNFKQKSLFILPSSYTCRPHDEQRENCLHEIFPFLNDISSHLRLRFFITFFFWGKICNIYFEGLILFRLCQTFGVKKRKLSARKTTNSTGRWKIHEVLSHDKQAWVLEGLGVSND